jgi:heat shock protein HslJ
VAAVNSISATAQDGLARPSVSPVALEGQGSSIPQTDKRTSELRDTFWHLDELPGVPATLSNVIVGIELLRTDGRTGIITFTTPSYSIPFSFVNRATGLDFSQVSSNNASMENGGLLQDQETAKFFESELAKTCYYELRGGILTFKDGDQHPTIVLSAVRQKGIENRRWRIARFRGNAGKTAQNDGMMEANAPAAITFMNGHIFGGPGCGAWVGNYTISGDNLTSDVSTMLAGLCSGAQATQAPLVEKALKGDRRIEQKDDHILLRDKSGKVQLLLLPF